MYKICVPFRWCPLQKITIEKRSVPLISTKILLANENIGLKGVLSFHYKLECFHLIFLLIKRDSLVSGIQSNKTYIDCQKLNNQNKHAGRGVAGSAITNGREL